MTLNELITFYSLTQVQDAYGTMTTTRTEIGKAYARVRPLSGSERDRSRQNEEYADYRFYVHNRTDVDGADIIVWNSVDYNVRFVASGNPREPYLYIDAERGAAV